MNNKNELIEEEILIKGTIKKLVFHNEEDGFVIARIDMLEPERKEMVIVGKMAAVSIGEMYQFKGKWSVDSRYGLQFNFDDYQILLPTTLEGVRRYLGSGLIKGVGPATASRIVEHFGEKTLEIIEQNPERLCEVEGIAEKRIQIIKKSWQEQKEIKRVMLFLQSYQVTTGYAVKIFKQYGTRAIEKLKENPYCLVDDIFGIGFKIADKIAQNLGIISDSPARIRAGIKYCLNEKAGQGHCFVYQDDLLIMTGELLGVNEKLVERELALLNHNKEVIIQNKQVWLPIYFNAEKEISQKIISLIRSPQQLTQLNIDQKIGQLEKKYKINFAQEQKQAIKEVLLHRVLILTGGPGTGKTTTTIGLIELFEELGLKIVLAAPTGRAAKKLSEATRRPARTIHRLLVYNPREKCFTKNEQNPIRADAVILDEVSMIDVLLMHCLLKAITEDTFLILIGDIDQLPSVGPGNLLKDFIDSGVIPVIRLTHIFRQKEKSLIVLNAHRVNQGQFPILNSKQERDFFFLKEENPEKAAQKIIQLCTYRLPRSYGFDPIRDIQVLTPMYKGAVGADQLNNLLRNALNATGKSVKYGHQQYKINDKVMQVRNNYDKEVFNGDIGNIKEIDYEEQMVKILFYRRVVEYDFSELNELVLAYAITVHKSQGSEYSVVVIPLLTQHFLLLQRNLLYTAITRAKRLVIIVGTSKALWIAIKNNKTIQRNTFLKERLQEMIHIENEKSLQE
ncbi:MAG: ATP-dependent RecD-like DNA helicase [Atribacterota bacterium]|nr:ATP-dependent RecD-like DNA helicase [Atribacterota bacterium]MDD4896159.1 ATP-dependent RecD-like DNA helicase [Atribacterota bacterium]MDD5637801.1 ATP-dependent RecD-like DNA helicase [Atribacterota bacterium]